MWTARISTNIGVYMCELVVYSEAKEESRIEENRFGKSREWAGRDQPNEI